MSNYSNCSGDQFITMSYLNGEMNIGNENNVSSPELLQFILSKGIINIEDIENKIAMKEREEFLSKHPYKIWKGTDDNWHTYIAGPDGKRVPKKRSKLSDLEDYIIDYYKQQEQQVFIKDIFEEWSTKKLQYGEIQKQSYDRYCSDFNRFFSPKETICKKEVKKITEEELEDFIKRTICNESLTMKTYSGMRLLIIGIFKYAK